MHQKEERFDLDEYLLHTYDGETSIEMEVDSNHVIPKHGLTTYGHNFIGNLCSLPLNIGLIFVTAGLGMYLLTIYLIVELLMSVLILLSTICNIYGGNSVMLDPYKWWLIALTRTTPILSLGLLDIINGVKKIDFHSFLLKLYK